ncbi:MAG: hydantoinase B/oxoprolinase family protein [Thermodesulfobacteriota bacterium]
MTEDKISRLTGGERITTVADQAGSEEKIGWGGQSLIEMLKNSESIFAESGAYHGLKKLELKEKDPMRFEKVFAKLRGALVSSRETAMHVTSSPIVRNIGELCFALYTPEGDSIVLSTGIIVHVHTMSEAIKYMIRNGYEDEPGIRPGDIFCNNDPVIGDVHTTDVATFVPLFVDQTLIGWAAGVTHQVDIGASVPGHDPVQTQNRFEDGYHVPCEKIGEKDKIYKIHRLRSQMAVRTPMFWDLDEKARLAGCHMIRQAVARIIREEGLDYYKRFIREVVEEGRRIFQARVRERLIPGVYHTATFSEVAFAETPLGQIERPRRDILMHAPISLEVSARGTFRFSMEGASRYGQHPFNCSLASMQGALWVILSQTIFYDGRVNDGAYFAVEHHFPLGSWANPGDPYAAYGTAWGFLIPSFTGLFRCLSRGFYARGFREEVVSGYGFTGDATQGGGFLVNGLYFPLAAFDLSSVGLGAGAIKDGLDYGYAIWNPEADMGDIEVWESLELGLPWLGRGVKPDTAGFGKYRGATSWENLRIAYGVKELLHYVVRTDGLTFHGPGLMGGYPHANGYKFWMLNTDFAQVVAQNKPYPLREGDPRKSEIEALIQGTAIRSERAQTLGKMLGNFDIVLSNMSGSPGFGDPIERDPERVRDDVNAGVYTAEKAAQVYGVVLNADQEGRTWSLDLDQTRRRREEIRNLRKARSITFNEFHAAQRRKVVEGRLAEPIKEMFRDSMDLSPTWAESYRRYWHLAPDFKF